MFCTRSWHRVFLSRGELGWARVQYWRFKLSSAVNGQGILAGEGSEIVDF